MMKEIQIPFEKNVRIVGNLHAPKDSSTLLILCHGFTDNKDVYAIKRLAELLEKYANVFRFTFTDKEPNLLIESKNILKITEYFSPRYKSIILVGGSLGCLSALLSTFNNKRVDKLILINPFIYFFEKITWRFRKVLILMTLLYPFSQRVRTSFSFYFKTLVPSKIGIPTLIIVGANDQIVSPLHAKTLYKQIGSVEKKLIIDNNIDHGLTKEQYLKTVTDYITNWLKIN